MGLTSVLQIGRSGISVSQAGIQIAGNNMANAATPGYSRQTMSTGSIRGQQIGPNAFSGNGVELRAVIRHVDEAVLGRLRSAISDQNSAEADQSLLSQIESLQNELTDTDLSTGLTEFFATWNELASRPNDSSVQALVVQRGAILTEQIQGLRQDYVELRTQIDRDLGTAVSKANELISRIAEINREISSSERGQGTNSALRDQRDNMLDELSSLIDISTNEQPNGAVDVFVGSIPVVLGDESRGLDLDVRASSTGTTVSVRVKADGSRLEIGSGRIGAFLNARDGAVQDAMDDLDQVSSSLIWNVNRAHSQGQGKIGFSSVTGTYQVADQTAVLDSAGADLPFAIQNGSFLLHLTDTGTGARSTYKINVDLDGVGTDMSLDDLVTQINSALGGTGATASVTGDGKLKIAADSGNELSFSEDSAGVLAGLGINTYFTGEDATDIAVNDVVIDTTGLLAVWMDHVEGSNGTALSIAQLDGQSLNELGGESFSAFWAKHVEDLAVRTGASNIRVESSRVIRESLDGQRAGVSGVSLDEESVNLINFQQQYQASARLIAMADQLTQVLLSIV